MQTLLDNHDEKELEEYLKSLPDNENCMYMRGKGVDLCLFKGACKFQGKETFTLREGELKECRRARFVQLKRILGK